MIRASRRTTVAARVLGLSILASAVGLAACGGAPAESQKAAVPSLSMSSRNTSTTSTSTSTVPTPTTTTTMPGVVVPNIVGLKITAAQTALQSAGFAMVPLNAACDKGTVASQSVVASLSIAGSGPNVAVGARPLTPGTPIPAGTRVAVTWSGCFGGGSVVPDVHGMPFSTATQTLTAAGLTWACYSMDIASPTAATVTAKTSPTPNPTNPKTTNSKTNPTTPPKTSTTTTTTAPDPQTSHDVIHEHPGPGDVLTPGTTVAISMPLCPS